jgi:hypothetical protein
MSLQIASCLENGAYSENEGIFRKWGFVPEKGIDFGMSLVIPEKKSILKYVHDIANFPVIRGFIS